MVKRFLAGPGGQDRARQPLCARGPAGSAAIHPQDPQGRWSRRAGIAGKPARALGQAAGRHPNGCAGGAEVSTKSIGMPQLECRNLAEERR